MKVYIVFKFYVKENQEFVFGVYSNAEKAKIVIKFKEAEAAELDELVTFRVSEEEVR